MKEKLNQEELKDLHELFQSLSDRHDAVISLVVDKKHFCFTPTNSISLSLAVLPKLFSEQGE